jgi:hypothetical protein
MIRAATLMPFLNDSRAARLMCRAEPTQAAPNGAFSQRPDVPSGTNASGADGAFSQRSQHETQNPSRDAPDFVEVGEAGIAVDDVMRRQRRVQLVG